MADQSVVVPKLTPIVPPGYPLPLSTPYAVSLSLPTWKDHSDFWLLGEKASYANSYPRLFPHRSVRELASILAQAHGSGEEKCLPFPTRRAAEECCTYMQARSVNAHFLTLIVRPENPLDNRILLLEKQNQRDDLDMTVAIHIVLFPADQLSLAHTFWYVTGLGISVRHADHHLSMVDRHSTASESGFSQATEDPTLCADGPSAKQALRRRIASGVLHNDLRDTTQLAPMVQQDSPDAVKVSESDVFLFPTGMTAIWSAHQLALQMRPIGKSVCFGAFFTTLTVLQDWGPRCHFYGNGSEADLNELEFLLEEERQRDSSKPPILAVFTEFPSNPLLWSPNLPRLRALADKHDFLVVIDDTIGGIVNVDVLPYADILVTSLTKLFSGYANALGGSLVLNPNCRHYAALKAHMTSTFEDRFYEGDAISMERNSRDFYQRVQAIDARAEAVCDLLHSRTVAAGAPNAIIKEVFYPKYITPENYERCRVKALRTSVIDDRDESAVREGGGGFGCLFSLTFTSAEASQAFFEALDCFKGLSFGMNVTVASPFAVSSATLGWGVPYGIEDSILRISVGLEDTGVLLQSFRAAVDAAEAAISTKSP